MTWLWLILFGLLSGVFAGMGMGGGTFLIPLLTIFLNVEQTHAQAINLIVFVPMAIVVCFIYMKDKLVDFSRAWIIALSAVVVTIFSSILAVRIGGDVLKIIFGSFVGAVGLWQGAATIIKLVKNKAK